MDMLRLLVPVLEQRHWYACLTSLAACGDAAMCRFLVEHGGVDVNVVHEGTTALYYAGTSLPPPDSC
jgi:hypothetical protein